MAAIVRHVFSRKTGQQISTNYEAVRFYASANRVKRIKPKKLASAEGQQIDSVAESLASRGYLRASKPYAPPSDARQMVEGLLETMTTPMKAGKFTDKQIKFEILAACFKAFDHAIPSPQLNETETIEDVIKFYQTPVDTRMPLDALRTVELPENLHIQHEYMRFHPTTDTMFDGKSAFPKSSTIVTGLKYKNKYDGHVAKKSWP